MIDRPRPLSAVTLGRHPGHRLPGLATSNLTALKVIGVGLTLAVILDATIIRALLVPAIMRLAGEANWWAPAPLRRLHQRLGLTD
ncbi:MMPL family transporter [Nocardioides lacusdianchii]|uniref:MMPL family transporter n=1 Tax=Nocardioides lacusdianchii TaxID=2783664 RepID=UPI001CCBE531|nr:MMPL family transporter [Nocardioides lacusdianchii]